MPLFDPATAEPVEAQSGFDPESATPVESTPKKEGSNPFALNEQEFKAASPLGRLKMMLSHPWDKYVSSVDQGFKGPVEIPKIQAPEGPGIDKRVDQLSAAGINVASGAAEGAISPGALLAVAQPTTVLYSVPRFVAGGINEIIDAVKGVSSGEDGLQKTTEKALGGALMVAGGVAGAKHGLGSEAVPKTPQEAISKIKEQADNTEDPQAKAALEAAAVKISEKASEGVKFDPESAVPVGEETNLGQNTETLSATPEEKPAPPGPEATKLSETPEGQQKLADIQEALKSPDTTIQYSVWDRDLVDPGEDRVLQVDLINDKAAATEHGGIASTSRALLNELGVDAPPAPDSLPPGRYTLEEVKAAIAKENPPAEHPAETTPTALPETPPETHGIAARVSEARAKAGDIAPIEPGEGISAEESVARGRDLVKQGADPQVAIDEFAKTSKISSDSMALVRARGAELAKAASDAEEKFGLESPEYKAAAEADSNWAKAVKPMQTEWHKIGQAQQGETDIDTGTFHGLRRAFQQATGEDFTPEQAKQAKDISSQVAKATAEENAAKQKVFDEIAKQVPEAKPTRRPALSKFISDQAAAARERIKARMAEGRVQSGLDPADLADHAIVGAEYIAKGVEAFADWSKEMVKEFGERIAPHLKDIFDQAKKTVEQTTDESIARALEARKARLETRIEELRTKVETGDTSVAGKKASRPSIEEIELLEQERDSLSKELSGMREHEAKIKELQNAIAEKEKKIAEADLSSKPTAQNRPAVKEIEELKSRREALNDKISEMRKEKRRDEGQEQRVKAEMERIQKSIDEKQAKLDSGDLSSKPGKASRPSVEPIEKLKQEREELTQKLAKARQIANKATEEEVLSRKLVAIEKKIEAQKAKLESGDLSSKQKPQNRPLPKELEEARQQLEAINSELAEARRTARKQANQPERGSTADILKRVKSYINSGETDFDNIRHKIATETGLSVEEVTTKMAETKKMREITNEMYAKMAARRNITNEAKQWVASQNVNPYVKALSIPFSAGFKLATFGHGTVAPFTHAPLHFFDPMTARLFWRNYFRGFKLMGLKDSGAYHARMMADLVRDPNYITARRAGLENDPHKISTDYEKAWAGGFFHRIGIMGNRGFDSLKIIRQELFNQQWESLSKSEQTRERAKLIADEVNHSTGTVKKKFGPIASSVLFAPRLVASQFAYLVGDTAKAADVLIRKASSADPAERSAAISHVKQIARIAGGLFSLLAINQGLLSATGSKQKVNFTDPSRSDFLRFKMAGLTVGVASSAIGSVALLANLFRQEFMEKQGADKRKTRGEMLTDTLKKYGRSKLSPTASVATDLIAGSDYSGRPLPYSKEKIPTYLRKEGEKAYTVPEYLATHVSPIPFSEAAREVWKHQGMDESTIGHWLKVLATGVEAGAVGARVSPDYYEGKPTK